MAGGVAMVLLGIVSQERAFEEIDFNVIFLLAGMMILAAHHPEDRRLRMDGSTGGSPRRRRSLPRSRRPERDHRHRQRLPRQRHDRRPGRTDHPLPGRADGHQSAAFHRQRDPGEQHRRRQHPHRGPAEHPHRKCRRPRFWRLPGQHGAALCAAARRLSRRGAMAVPRPARRRSRSCATRCSHSTSGR